MDNDVFLGGAGNDWLILGGLATTQPMAKMATTL